MKYFSRNCFYDYVPPIQRYITAVSGSGHWSLLANVTNPLDSPRLVPGGGQSVYEVKETGDGNVF